MRKNHNCPKCEKGVLEYDKMMELYVCDSCLYNCSEETLKELPKVKATGKHEPEIKKEGEQTAPKGTKKGSCIACGREKDLNAKGLCPACEYARTQKFDGDVDKVIEYRKNNPVTSLGSKKTKPNKPRKPVETQKPTQKQDGEGLEMTDIEKQIYKILKDVPDQEAKVVIAVDLTIKATNYRIVGGEEEE